MSKNRVDDSQEISMMGHGHSWPLELKKCAAHLLADLISEATFWCKNC